MDQNEINIRNYLSTLPELDLLILGLTGMDLNKASFDYILGVIVNKIITAEILQTYVDSNFADADPSLQEPEAKSYVINNLLYLQVTLQNVLENEEIAKIIDGIRKNHVTKEAKSTL